MRRLSKRRYPVLLLLVGLCAGVPARAEPAQPPQTPESTQTLETLETLGIEALREELRQLRKEVAALRASQLGGMSEQERRELLDAQIEHADQQA